MSVRADGRHECDRCGFDLGGGGVAQAVLVSDLDPGSPGAIRVLEFCRDHPGGNGGSGDGGSVAGCAALLFAGDMLAHYDGRTGRG